MSVVPSLSPERESRLDEALGAFFAEAASGRPVDQREFIGRHPDLAEDLGRFFADDDALGSLLTPLRPARHPLPGPGGSFGDYVLLEVIGTGGAGVVYKARQQSLNRLVALKMVRDGALGSAQGRTRFRAEAATVAALDHPNIVPVYEVGEHAGRLFFTMKFLEGGDLSAVGIKDRESGLSKEGQRRVAALVAEAARAVHYAHLRGVLHRDLKPSNVLLDAEGRPHVADFGLAKWLTAEVSLTETGALIGTPSYMAPEQAAGQEEEVGPATDVYGLGSVLYCLLVGRPPFRAGSALATLEQVRSGAPIPPSRLEPDVSRDLEAICQKCLDKEPGRRYASALDLADDLQRFLEDRPPIARPAGLLSRTWHWLQRPERMRDAGRFTVVMHLLLLIWCLVGLAALSSGWLRPAEPEQSVYYLLIEIALAHLPCIGAGLFTARRKLWAIWAGIVISVLLVAGDVHDLFTAQYDVGGLYNHADPGLSFAFDSLITMLCTLQLGVFLVAILSYYKNKPTLDWMGKCVEQRRSIAHGHSRYRSVRTSGRTGN